MSSIRRLWVSETSELFKLHKVTFLDLQKYPYILLNSD